MSRGRTALFVSHGCTWLSRREAALLPSSLDTNLTHIGVAVSCTDSSELTSYTIAHSASLLTSLSCVYIAYVKFWRPATHINGEKFAHLSWITIVHLKIHARAI
eukprot:1375269-Amphidinium_carterae.2